MQQDSLQGFHLSRQQRRLWQLGGHGNAYTAQCVVRLEGTLDRGRLTAALERTAACHEALRTAYRGAGELEVPIQVVEDEVGTFEVREATLPEATDEAIEALARSEREADFDFETTPLLRVVLADLGSGNTAMVLSTPSLCLDTRSLGNLVAEIARSYGEIARGEEPEIDAEEVIQYVQFAEWEHELLDEEEVREERQGFWNQQDVGSAPAVVLPQDKGSTDAPFAPDFVSFTLPATPGDGRESFLFTCWSALLARLSRQSRLTVSTIADGRWLDALEDGLGLYARALPVTVRATGEQSFFSLERELRSAVEAVFEQREYESTGNTAGDALAFGFEYLAQEASATEDGLLFRVLTQRAPLGPSALTLRCLAAADGGEQVTAELEFDSARFDRGDVEALAEQLRLLAESAAQEPETRLDQLALISSEGRQELLDAFEGDSGVGSDLPAEQLIHHRFEAQAERTPDDLAVRWQDQALTYAELEAQANQLAHRLRHLGVGPDVPVVLCLERTHDVITALLAVLKAGGYYVPMMPDQPQRRLASMIEQFDSPLVITHAAVADKVSEVAERTFVLDAEGDALAQESQEPLGPVARGENLAYVIFTSGSTGQPKGVMVEHRNLASYTQAILERLAPEAGLGFGLVSTFAADLGNTVLFPALLTGGRLEVIPQEVATDPAALAALYEENGVDVVKIAPSHLEALRSHPLRAKLMPRRILVLGGEASRPKMLAEIATEQPELTIYNHYGPTETTVGVLTLRFGDQPMDGRCGSVPIGRPLAGVWLRLVDRHQEPVPTWHLGELALGGSSVTRGYVGQPGTTAERFTPDPAAQVPGARVYRTGDLVRHLPSGDVEFMGRADNQVKFHGFRIELDELKRALARDERVREALVLKQHDEQGNELLVAFYVATQELPAAELRATMGESLPEEILPTHFVHLKRFPYTPNGKVDTKALPDASEIQATSERAAYVAPRTDTEARIAELWAEILGLERVGVDESFFDLGGHSLLATRLIGVVQEHLHVAVSLHRFLEEPTVAGLAVAIAQINAGEAEAGVSFEELPPIVPQPELRHEPFPLNEVQQAYWIGRIGVFELGNVATHTYFEFEREALDLERFQNALDRLIERHDMMRGIVLEEGEQVVLTEVPRYEIPVLDLRGRSAEEVESELQTLRHEMSEQVFDPEIWPLFDFRVTRLDGGLDRIHVARDALIFDAWSAAILFSEWSTLYHQPETTLAPLEVTFRDYVLAEHEFQHSEAFEHSWKYWRERLETLPPAPELPLAKDPASIDKPTFKRRNTTIDRGRWQRLKQRAAKAGLTPSGLIVTAFSTILGKWCSTPRFTLNLTLFHRLPLHEQVHDIIGDFTSMTLLEVDPPAGSSFEVRGRRLQERLWRDLEHRQVSGVRVLRELARTQGRKPGALVPVVLTSLLALDDEERDRARRDLLGTLVDSLSVTSQVWIDHAVVEEEGALLLHWNAVDELFPTGLLDDAFEAYVELLIRLADSEEYWQEPPRELLPQAQVAERALLNAAADAPGQEWLHTLFYRQVEARGDAPAVIAPERTLSYTELNRRALRLGHGLFAAGVVPNQLVAVVMEKGWEQVVAVLAVLEAGGAYLPIDANLPQERIDHLLEHGQVQHVIAQPHIASRLQWPDFVQLWTIEAEESAGDVPPAVAKPRQSPGDLAYVIFTSGSTGLPKGVMIDHVGAVNTVLDVNSRFTIGPEDRVLALSALNFDLSVWDVFGVLAAGGALVLPEPTANRDPGRWLELVEGAKVTTWNSVPALVEMMVEYAAADSADGPHPGLASLRLVMMSGDWIPVSLPQRTRTLVEGVELISMGGATEASIWSILYPIGEVDPSWPSIPYGKPMKNQEFHVLDDDLEPCPVWVPGKLLIGGIGLAKGYWRDEEKSAASFFKHPRTGENLYLTGDLGRYLPDGNIEFLGRDDFQVKIQGHRIELGEIESALLDHPEVSAAVVTAPGERTRRRLVAYVVPSQQDAQIVAEDAWKAPALLKEEGPRLAFKLRQPGLRRFEGAPASVELPAGELGAAERQAFEERRSYRSFSPKALSPDQLGGLLSALYQLEIDGVPVPKLLYPSAGHLYPLGAYLYIKPDRVQGLPGGTWYYDPTQHRLVELEASAELAPEVFTANNRGIFEGAAGALFLVAPMAAAEAIYGERARELCLLEAGYLSQLLMHVGPGERIGLCPVGTTDMDLLRQPFGLDDGHQVLHTLLWGQLPEAGEVVDAPTGAGAPTNSPSGDQQPSAPPLANTSAVVTNDPAERLRIKMSRPGLRRFEDGHPAVDLPALPEASELMKSYEGRRSFRRFEEEAVPAEALSQLLATLRQLKLDDQPLPKYRYPSAGNLYPVQAYVYVAPGRVEGLAGGAYYYQPQEHRLIPTDTDARLSADLVTPNNRAIFEASGLALFLVADLEAILPIYGPLAVEFCLLEAGYMGQLLMSEATAQRIGLCPVGSADAQQMRKAFHLTEGRHLVLHTLLGGRIAADAQRLERWLADPLGEMSMDSTKLPEVAAGGSTLAGGPKSLTEELQTYLEDKIPAYMVPGIFTLLDQLPLTANGKVDRSALPDPEQEAEDETVAYVEPRNELEHKIVAVWQEVLKKDRIGATENFFDLGGTSVDMVQAHVKLRQILDVELRITDLFENTSIEALARAVALKAQTAGGAEQREPAAGAARDAGARQRQALEAQRRRMQERLKNRG